MQILINSVQRSASLKIFTIGVLSLLMLIPMAMIRGVIFDRQQTGEQARHDITRAWGGSQILGGPVLVLPYKLVRVTQYGERVVSDGKMQILPEDLQIEARLVTEMRYRGVHEVPVYTASVRVRGTFAEFDTSGLGIDTAVVDWERAFLAMSVSDARALRNTPAIELQDKAVSTTIRFEAGGRQVANLPPQIIAPLGDTFVDQVPSGALGFEIGVELSGTDRLQFLPLANSTSVKIDGAWPSPSFSGRYLPETRNISDAGFSAAWRVSSLGRDLPSRWLDNEQKNWNVEAAAFGVDLFMPIGLYQLSTRATKYAILFIGLTFIAYFLFEVISGLRLHPLQYLLVGLANTVFYLLLLSLAEHIGFGWSYLISSLGSSGLIAGYSFAILGSRRRALMMIGILLILYSYLYMILQAESFAMLGGSIGLWVTLALIMYLTRQIDWYGRQPGGDSEGADGNSTRNDTPSSVFSADTDPA
jgi:inner membrane protein